MYICILMYLSLYLSINKSTSTFMCTRIHVYQSMHAYFWIYIHYHCLRPVYIHTYIHMYAYMCICILCHCLCPAHYDLCVWVYPYIHTHIYIYIYVYTHVHMYTFVYMSTHFFLEYHTCSTTASCAARRQSQLEGTRTVARFSCT